MHASLNESDAVCMLRASHDLVGFFSINVIAVWMTCVPANYRISRAGYLPFYLYPERESSRLGFIYVRLLECIPAAFLFGTFAQACILAARRFAATGTERFDLNRPAWSLESEIVQIGGLIYW